MNRKMKALLYTGPYRLSMTEVPIPQVGEDEVLIRVKACGICGSDVHGYTGKTGRRIPPLIMGHEAAGLIEKVGSLAKGRFEVGQRVTFDSTVFCNRCHFCRLGMINHCLKRQVFGVSTKSYRRHGAFAEYVAAPWWVVYPIPEELSFEYAAMLEPCAVALHAVNRTPIHPEDTVIVIGAGTIGLLVVACVKLKGARRVIAVDLDSSRLRIASQMGADLVLNPKEGDIPERVKELTDSLGADVVLEAVGIPETVKEALDIVRSDGQVTLIGNLTPRVEVGLQDIISREINIRGTYASAGEHRDCISLFTSGKINPAPILSKVLPLSEGPRVFKELLEGRPGLLKVILKPLFSEE